MAELVQPTAEIRLEGRTVSRGAVLNDWGSRLHWKVLRDGVEVATPEARSATAWTLDETAPGNYEIVLETRKHEGYQSKALGKYVEISNRVALKL